jgi:hypothetical protein
MSKESHGTLALANLCTTETCGGSRKNLRCDVQVISVCQALFPIKAALNISDLTGYPLRTVEYWFAGGKMPADALALLIRSEYGLSFVAAIMTDAQPSWWRKIKSYVLSLDSLSFHRVAQRKLKEALDEDTQFNADFARTQASLSVRDEDFFGPHLDALRATGPQSHRSVADKKR